MKRMLYRMVLRTEDEEYTLPSSVEIRGYCAKRHHEAICSMYGRSFEELPWSSDWDEFDEFDANGAFVAEDVGTSEAIGYLLSFRRCDYGYISVLAVVPEYRRQGVGFALVRRAVRYLRGLGLRTIKVDALVDATPAVNLYQELGFRVESTFEDE